ncbi:uncharacterized protein LOC128963914 [Oppia nitens]|uniref:uncharacterized protein LOC128963914 n=1 Tax=Oppia nitens TaxID=1686743 RepID=UPI0023DA42D8|nr:uncharacterized protein LOC128963914 [Oppia nitens]
MKIILLLSFLLIINFAFTRQTSDNQTAAKVVDNNGSATTPTPPTVSVVGKAEKLPSKSLIDQFIDDSLQMPFFTDKDKEETNKMLAKHRESIESFEKTMNEHQKEMDKNMNNFQKNFQPFFSPSIAISLDSIGPNDIKSDDNNVKQSQSQLTSRDTKSDDNVLWESIHDFGNHEKPLAQIMFDVDINFDNSSINGTEAEQMKSPISKIVDTLFGSFVQNLDDVFANIGLKEKNSVHTNNTETGDDGLMVNGMIMIDCKCPDGQHGVHEEDCPMSKNHTVSENEKKTLLSDNYDDEIPSPGDLVRDADGTVHLLAVLNKKTGQLMSINDLNKQINNKSPVVKNGNPNIAVGYGFKEEIKLVSSNSDDYKWYDWLLMSMIVVTSVLLMATALSLCCKRFRRSKSAKLADILSKVERETVKTENIYSTTDSVKNENFNQIGIEKIKTVLSNMK